MATVEACRPLVVARAGGACEYCRLLQEAAGVTFHVEHVQPQTLGGQTVLSNLALSCPGCNLSKGSRTTGRDASGMEMPLFNPRLYEPWLWVGISTLSWIEAPAKSWRERRLAKPQSPH
jgi:hypothetical protein